MENIYLSIENMRKSQIFELNLHEVLAVFQVKCTAIVKSPPPGQKFRSNAPRLPEDGMVTLGID